MKIKTAILNLYILFLGITSYTQSLAEPPEPELGQRWIINPLLSDEFNDTALDESKWFNFHPMWDGRPPAKFMPSSVSVNNGKAQIRASLLDTPDRNFTIAGGAIRSRNEAKFGYYEASMKASKINMSSTFWMSNNSTPLIGPNNQAIDCISDQWSLELDIIESVGGTIQQAWGKSFRTTQNYNTHVHYKTCNGGHANYSAGVHATEGNGANAISNELPGGQEVWQDYNTYAVWWKNANDADFYLNNTLSGQVEFNRDLLQEPFSREMAINLVMETYDWATPYPSANELANNAINTTYYDWVRSYELIAADDDAPVYQSSVIKNPGFEYGNLDHFRTWGDKHEIEQTHVNSGQYAVKIRGQSGLEYYAAVQKNTNYRLSVYALVNRGKLSLGAKPISFNQQPWFGETAQYSTSGQYQRVDFMFNSGDQHSVKFFVVASDGAEFYIDDFELEALDYLEPVATNASDIFDEQFTVKSFSRHQNGLDVRFTYKSDKDIYAKLAVFTGNRVIRRGVHLKAGYGHVQKHFDIDNFDNINASGFRLNMRSADTNTWLYSTEIIDFH